jgi:hypothetical protein
MSAVKETRKPSLRVFSYFLVINADIECIENCGTDQQNTGDIGHCFACIKQCGHIPNINQMLIV